MVDHVGDVIHIDTPGCHIGGDEDIYFARFETSHGSLPSVLAEVTMNSTCNETSVIELVHQPSSSALSAGEDDGFAPTFRLQNAANDFVFIERVGAIDEVLDIGLGDGLIR